MASGSKREGQPRITDEADWVRIEIEAALGKKIPVIPVLIDRTPLPKPNELPEALREFAYRQATNIDTGVDFKTQMDRLIHSMDELLEGEGVATKPNAAQRSDRTELDTNRSVVGLLGRANLGTVQRSTTGWVTRQAITWFQMVKSPKDFVSSIDLASADELGIRSSFCFLLLCAWRYCTFH